MSENYRALTRTYRPISFDDIVSQEHVSSTLKNAIKQERLAHAYMFCGPRGVGKTTMARVLARAVNNIDQKVDGESLNQTLNVIEIDAASNNSVDDVRDLRERVRIPPQNGRYKIYIIDEVHMLSKSAFNALLKTLEEPPDHVIFIFATTEPHKILPTILSRVQRFDFKRISVDEIVKRLGKVAEDENIRIDQESLHVIAKKADGALRDALGLMDQAIAFCGNDIQHEELLRALNVVSTERMFDFMSAVEEHDASRGLELINELLQEGYDIQEYLVGLTEHLRNLYVARSSNKMHLVEASPDTKKQYKKAADAFSEDDLMRMLHIVSEAQYKIKEAHQPKIQFEITLLKLIHMERSQKLNTLLTELQQLKKKLNDQPQLTTEEPEEDQAVSEQGIEDEEEASQDAQADSPDNPHQASSPSTPNKKAEEESAQVADSGRSPERADVKTTPEQTSEPEAPSEPAPKDSAETVTGVDKEEKSQEALSLSEAEINEEENIEDLFGKSSLGSVAPANGTVSKTKKTTDTPIATAEKRAPKNLTLEEIVDAWDAYLQELRQQVPQMLYFQMQRIEPVKVKNGELILRCNDDFAKKIVDENKRGLGKILEKEIGAFLSFKCTVQKDESNLEESMSPYERFKKLQERDPTIKKLVELFGAELDYNLNQ